MGALGRVLGAGAATAVAGCAQVGGIVTTTPEGPATFQVQRASIGASVVTTALELSLDPVVFLVADASEDCGMRLVQGTQAAPDTWTVTADGTPGAVYTAPDGALHELAFASRAQRGLYWAYEHPNPTPPAPTSQLELAVTLPTPYAATETFSLEAIGPWARHPLAAGELPAVGGGAIATTLAYSAFAKSAPGPAARILKQDVVVLLRYRGADLTGVWQADMFDQSDTTDSLGGPSVMTPVSDDHAFDATISPAAIAARFAGVRPAVASPQASWAIYASAGYSVGTFPGVRLNSGPIAPTDTTIAAGFPMPFAALGWRAALEYVASATRTYTLGGAPTSLQALAYTIADPASGMTLGGTPLDVDGMTVTLDVTKAAVVDIVPDTAASALYQVELDELISDGTTVKRTAVASVLGPDKHFVLPAWFFAMNHTYTISAQTIVGGYPDAAAGNLATFALPMSVGQLDSAVFTVVPP